MSGRKDDHEQASSQHPYGLTSNITKFGKRAPFLLGPLNQTKWQDKTQTALLESSLHTCNQIKEAKCSYGVL